jgi:hypothetical protein
LFAHFKQVIEILNTDAAADERKAMRLLRSRSQGSAASSAAMLNRVGDKTDPCNNPTSIVIGILSSPHISTTVFA